VKQEPCEGIEASASITIPRARLSGSVAGFPRAQRSGVTEVKLCHIVQDVHGWDRVGSTCVGMSTSRKVNRRSEVFRKLVVKCDRGSWFERIRCPIVLWFSSPVGLIAGT
jgi:hypothetical protein